MGTRPTSGAGVASVGACDRHAGTDETPGQAAATSAPALAAPTSAPLDKPCLEDVGSARPFPFPTSAGAMLVGVALGHGRAGLVFAHGRGGDLCDWLPRAQEFARQGYHALAFDFEGFGDSRPGSKPDARRLETDVAAAVQQLRRRGAERIVLVGSSMGATAALVAATRIRPPVAGVVSLSGPGAFGAVNAWAAMPRLRVPVLFVAGLTMLAYPEGGRGCGPPCGGSSPTRRGAHRRERTPAPLGLLVGALTAGLVLSSSLISLARQHRR